MVLATAQQTLFKMHKGKVRARALRTVRNSSSDPFVKRVPTLLWRHIVRADEALNPCLLVTEWKDFTWDARRSPSRLPTVQPFRARTPALPDAAAVGRDRGDASGSMDAATAPIASAACIVVKAAALTDPDSRCATVAYDHDVTAITALGRVPDASRRSAPQPRRGLRRPDRRPRPRPTRGGPPARHLLRRLLPPRPPAASNAHAQTACSARRRALRPPPTRPPTPALGGRAAGATLECWNWLRPRALNQGNDFLPLHTNRHADDPV